MVSTNGNATDFTALCKFRQLASALCVRPRSVPGVLGRGEQHVTVRHNSRPAERISKGRIVFIRQRVGGEKIVQIPSYLACTLLFHPETVRARSRNFQAQGCNFSKLPPFCPNDGMSIRCHNLFLSPPFSLGTFPPSRHPLNPPRPYSPLSPLQNMGPSACLLIYKCLCVLKCGTKGTGL